MSCSLRTLSGCSSWNGCHHPHGASVSTRHCASTADAIVTGEHQARAQDPRVGRRLVHRPPSTVGTGAEAGLWWLDQTSPACPLLVSTSHVAANSVTGASQCCPGTSRAQPSTHMSLSASVPVADGRETHVAGLTSMEAHGAQGPHQDIPFATNKARSVTPPASQFMKAYPQGIILVTFAFAFPVGQDPKGYRHGAVSEKDAHMQSYLRTVQVFLFRMDLRSHTSPLCAQLGIETSTKWQPPGCLATRLPG
ncbi:hypothetical protein B296_00051846 [Ensete ventricosum]|uniref:Uncharacterized protein n=1 Tax=Ensete ventricosum TaxID=4639 RepID=A0A426XTR2_ENSVE|nr:hypothetical protein B296_00051846 [Ensete ventricosum]